MPEACSIILKNSLCRRSFPVNFAEFLRTPILQNTSGRLLLYYQPAFLQGSSLDLILRSYDLGLNLGKNWKYIRAFWEICHQHKLKRQSISTKSWQYFAYKFSITLHEKCPNTEFFPGPYFPVFGLNPEIYGVQLQEIYVFGYFSRSLNHWSLTGVSMVLRNFFLFRNWLNIYLDIMNFALFIATVSRNFVFLVIQANYNLLKKY